MASTSPRTWLSILVGGTVLVVGALAAPAGWSAAIWTGVQLTGLGIATYALTRRDAGHRSGWWLILASCGLGTAGDALYVLPAETLTELAWVVLLAARYAVFVVGLLLLLGARRALPAEQNLLDAGIVAAGLAIVAWTFLVEPSLGARAPSASHFGVAVSYTVLDALMLYCLIRIIFRMRSRSPTMLLLAAAGGVVLLADLAHATRIATDGLVAFQPGHGIHLAWQVCGVLIAAAAMHPSFGVGDPTPDRRTDRQHVGDLPRGRYLAFIVVALLAPVLPVAGLIKSGGLRTEHALTSLVGSASLTGTLLVLLVARLGMAARLAGRRAQAMDLQATALLVQANALQRALEEQNTLQTQLSHRALHDALTGLANRVLLADRLERMMATQGRAPGGLLLLDLDGFKDVNDTLGHPVGDELLVQVARRLLRVAGDADVVARLGGDEFALLFTGADEAGCREAAGRVIEALREVYPLVGREVYLAASAGLLFLEPERVDPAEALRDADLALYAAKEAGKNQVVEFCVTMREARMRYAELAAGLRGALAEDALTVYFQPIVDLTTGAPVALEALLRWRTADGRAISPSQFVPVAEEIGLVVEMGTKALRTACRHAREWYERYGVAMSVNVSGRQLSTPDFSDLVLATLADVSLPPCALIVEITETVLVGATTAVSDHSHDNLVRLRAQGVRIAVDDFGTGYSSLSYLHRLPIDILKVDRTFTAALDADGDRGSMFLSAILRLGASLGVPTIAEGVETPRQAALLLELECPLAQGYHFSQPAPADEIGGYLAGLAGQPARVESRPVARNESPSAGPRVPGGDWVAAMSTSRVSRE